MQDGVAADGTAEIQDYETAGQDRHANLRLWLRLLTCTTLVESEVRTRLQAGFQTTLPKFDLMAQLDRVEGGLTMGELSARLMVSNGNITGIVDRLEADTFVVRVPSKTDRRAFHVKLTPKGRTAFRKMATQHEAWIDELFGGLGEDDVRTLLRLLGRAKESVRGAKAAPVVAVKEPKARAKRAAK